jgi:sporulation integral membrane protein YlbJ
MKLAIAAALIFPILLYLKSRSGRVIYLKNLFVPALSLIFIVFLVLFSKTAVNSASRGLKLWLEAVFPSLFPFFVAANILHGSNIVKAAGILLEPIMRPLFNVPGCSSFAFLMGLTSGYPMGAKITTKMYEDKELTKSEAERLLSFTNNSGPLFIVGAVSVGMFKMPQTGILLLGCHIAACISVALIFRFYKIKEKSPGYEKKNYFLRAKSVLLESNKNKTKSFGAKLGESIQNSVMTLLMIGGFIILFSVIISFLSESGVINLLADFALVLLSPLGVEKEIIVSILSGIFEITTGTNMASKALGIELPAKLAAASFIIGWAGLSVHAQVMSIVSSSNLCIKPYLVGKLLQGILASIYTYMAAVLSKSALLTFKPVSPDTPTKPWGSPLQYLSASLIILVFVVLFFMLLNLFFAFRRRSRKPRKMN